MINFQNHLREFVDTQTSYAFVFARQEGEYFNDFIVSFKVWKQASHDKLHQILLIFYGSIVHSMGNFSNREVFVVTCIFLIYQNQPLIKRERKTKRQTGCVTTSYYNDNQICCIYGYVENITPSFCHLDITHPPLTFLLQSITH